jgi:uncharacterized membrane protein (UPF0127 family)
LKPVRRLTEAEGGAAVATTFVPGYDLSGVRSPEQTMQRRNLANSGLWLGLAMIIIHGFGSGCNTVTAADPSNRQFPLDELKTGTITVGQTEIQVWVMQTAAEQAEGMMHLNGSDVPDNQGMLFVFDNEQVRRFWMQNTFIPLDIAYARTDGTIVTIAELEPLNLVSVSSVLPARFVLEMKAGAFERLGIRAGDLMDIPLDLMN